MFYSLTFCFLLIKKRFRWIFGYGKSYFLLNSVVFLCRTMAFAIFRLKIESDEMYGFQKKALTL